MNFLQNVKFVQGLAPVADRYTGDPATDVVNMGPYHKCTFVISEGVGTTGTTVVTVESCDNVTPSNTQVVAFRYKIITSGDTEGLLITATTAGFTTTAGSNHIYVIEVNSAELDGTDQYVRLKTTEAVASAVLSGISIFLHEPRHASDSMVTAIV